MKVDYQIFHKLNDCPKAKHRGFPKSKHFGINGASFFKFGKSAPEQEKKCQQTKIK